MSRTDTTAPTELQQTTAFAVTGAFVSNTRYAKFARSARGLAMLTHAMFAVVFMVLHVPLMVWINLAGIAVYAVCISLTRSNRSGWVNWLIMLELLGHAVIATRVVGWASGFQFYAWLTIPLAAINTRSSLSRKITVVVLMCLACLGMELWLQSVPALTILSTNTIRFLHAYNLAAYLAIMAALAFVYAQTVAEAERGLHKHAITDSLTGLRNRRRLLELAHDELARANRSGAPVSLIIADIDQFKSINDHFGHPTGDLVIASVAQRLRESVRRQDLVARWGGEEFLIVLPDIDLQGAYAAAERMRQSIEQLRVSTKLETVHCTASFGVSEWNSRHNETFEQCLGRADAALYAAKHSGRNRVNQSQTPALAEHRVAEVLAGDSATHHQPSGAASNLTQAMPSHRNAG